MIWIGIVGCLFVAPLCFGGRHDAGRLLYAVAVSVAAAGSATTAPSLRRVSGPAAIISAAAVAVVVTHLIPLPESWLRLATPARADLLPAWGSEGGPLFGAWPTISLTPYSTRIGLAVLLSHVALFWATATVLKTEKDVRRLLTLIGGAAVLMAAFGLLQHATSNGKLLWLYEHPHRAIGESVQGAFANKNHFGHFLVLGVAPLIGAAFSPRAPSANGQAGRRTAAFWCCAALVTVTAVLLSLSRGAVAALAATLVSAGFLLWRSRQLRAGQLLAAVLAGSLGVLGAVSVYGYHDVAKRLGDFGEGSITALDKRHGRRLIWQANLDAQAESPWLGYGVGSHREVYKTYFDAPFVTEFTHCESGYLHLLTEAGLVGAVVAVGAISLLVVWGVKGWRSAATVERRLLWAMLLPGLIGSLLHSLVDFVWFVPACASVTVMLAAAACRLAAVQQAGGSSVAARTPPHEAVPRRASGGLLIRWSPLLACSVAIALLVRPAWASLAWDAYLRDSVAMRKIMASVGGDRPNDPQTESMKAFLLDRAIASLEETLRRAPDHARANARLATRLAERFETLAEMGGGVTKLNQLRSAAHASGFTSRGETLAWLQRAYGPLAEDLSRAHLHAGKAVGCCPLQGEVYGLLNELDYLVAPDRRQADLIDRQALALRPFSGSVLFNSGRRRILQGEIAGGVSLWKRALRRPGRHQRQIVMLLVGKMPAAEFLNVFEPDWNVLWLVLREFAHHGDEDDRLALAKYAEEAASREEPRTTALRAAHIWSAAAKAARRANRPESEIFCAENAYRLAPSLYPIRRMLGFAYLAAGRHDDADSHFRWCAARKPDDTKLSAALREIAAARRTLYGSAVR